MSTPTLDTAGGDEFAAGYAGQIASGIPHQIISCVNDNAAHNAPALDFGIAAVRAATGDGDNMCHVMTADTDKILGITVRSETIHAVDPAVGTITYKAYDNVGIIIDGVVFAVAAENVRCDDQVLALTASGGTLGGAAGGVAGTGRIDVAGAKWLDTVSAGSVGRILIHTVGFRRITT